MSKIKNSGLDQYGAEPFEQQQFGKAGVEGVKLESIANKFVSRAANCTRNHGTIYRIYVNDSEYSDATVIYCMILQVNRLRH